jgi:light-regulated signal transduction histidine kinase (bacteriophytochrome)
VNAKILNVDDHDAARYARSRFLNRAGFQVLEAATGGEAIQIVRDERPDIVLLDINLPDINGLEVCQLLRADPDNRRLPIIFLTASRQADSDVVTGLESGADNYLREPLDPAILIATVRAFLRAREAEEALVRSNEQLRRFAYVVSHELQEPLRMVKSYTQLLASRYEGKLDKDADDYIAYSIQGVNRMESFIRDMLSYSQAAEAGLQVKPTTCKAVLDWSLLELDRVIRESGAEITFDPLPAIMCDPMRLAQVFNNLIGNAIKYKGEGTPRIHIAATDQEDMWRLSVSDNGIGIDPRYASTIFTLFKRLHGRETPGSGVGLAICKQIVENHGGEIWVESQAGQGSTFYFTLPKRNAEPANAAP